MRLVLAGGSNSPSAPDPALVKAIGRAQRGVDDLASGRAASFAEVAQADGVTDRYVSHLMPLAFVAPDIVEAILEGRQPADLTAERLIKRLDLLLAWADQRALLGFG